MPGIVWSHIGSLRESSGRCEIEAFVGVDGISATAGCTTHHEVEAYTNRALISRATRVVVVADSSKLGRVAFARICSLADVDELITDTSANSDDVHALEATGLLVTRV